MSLHTHDKRAAFTGLIAGAVFIFAFCYAIVVWTNAQHAGHASAAGGAGAPAGAQGAATGH